MRALRSLLTMGCVFSMALSLAWAAPPEKINLQGLLTSGAGVPAPDGLYGITLRLFDAQTGGEKLHEESFGAANSVTVTNGRFSLIAGSITPLPVGALIGADQLWVELQVEVDEPLPRRRVWSTPFAMSAGIAATASNLACSGCVTPGALSFDVYTKAEVDAKLAVLDVEPVVPSGAALPACAAGTLGKLFYDTSVKKLMMCDGVAYRAVKFCLQDCADAAEVACGQAIVDDCGDDCKAIGTGLNTAVCALKAASAVCNAEIKDDCDNVCPIVGSNLDLAQCAAADASPCGVLVTDPCGNGCGYVGSGCPASQECVANGCAEVGKDPKTAKTTCKALLDAGVVESGTYWIDPDGDDPKSPFQVYCDMTTDKGGWTLVVKLAGNNATMNRANKSQWRDRIALGSIMDMSAENALGASYDTVPFTDVLIRSVSNAGKNLAWRHPNQHASMWAVVDAGKRVTDGVKLFGAVSNLHFNGNATYHNDSSILKFGFFTADHTQAYTGIAGHSLVHGHAGGVLGASIMDPTGAMSHNYGPDNGKTTNCITDFAVGGGYDNLGGDDSYAINAHWWGAGNTHTASWQAHAVFVR